MTGALIVNGTGVSTKPALINPGGTEQWGTEGDGVSVMGSVWDADTTNKIGGEISSLIQGLGLALNMADPTQLLALLGARFARMSIQGTAGSYTFTVPAAVFYLDIEMWAAGAKGGDGNGGGGGGGGGGSYSRGTFAVTPGQVVTYTVGAGGTSGTPSGGASTVAFASITLTCPGGNAGGAGVAGGLSAFGGATTTPANVNCFNQVGGEAHVGDAFTASGRTGAGGGAHGSSGASETITASGFQGNVGSSPGAGGAGGGMSASGGPGHDGLVIFRY